MDAEIPSPPERWNRVLPSVVVGGCPQSPDDIADLKRRFGITAVLTLQTAGDRRVYKIDWGSLQEAYRHSGIRVRQCPILDASEPALARRLPRAVEALDRLVGEGHTVLCHCNAGNGRSPTVVAAWLHWRRGWSLPAAVDYLRRRRPCEPNGPVVRRAEQATRTRS